MALHKHTPAGRAFITRKLHEIRSKGVRRNTRAPVSVKNPRRVVEKGQALAIAQDEARKRGIKVPPKPKG